MLLTALHMRMLIAKAQHLLQSLAVMGKGHSPNSPYLQAYEAEY